MYHYFLLLHSWWRWLVLFMLLYAVIHSITAFRRDKPFVRNDDMLCYAVPIVLYIQLFTGLALYFTSPLTNYFLSHFKIAVHERELRFFGMEHLTVMTAAVIVVSIGSATARRNADHKEKFRMMYSWYTAGLILILTSVPWSFSPLVSRPSFRPFW